MPSFLEQRLSNNGPFRAGIWWHSAAAFAHTSKYTYIRTKTLTFTTLLPTHAHPQTDVESAEKAVRLNNSQQNVSRAVQHQTIWGLCFLSPSPPFPPSVSLSPPEVWCSVDEPGALLPPSYMALCSRINIWGQFALRRSLVAGVWRCSSALDSNNTYRRTDSQLVSGHRYLTRKSAKCTVYIFTTAVRAGQPCSRADAHTSAFANLWEGRRLNSLRGLKVSWGGFCITIFTFNEMLHSMQI